MSDQEKEDYKKALIEIVEGYRFGRFPDAIRIAEETLERYGRKPIFIKSKDKNV